MSKSLVLAVAVLLCMLAMSASADRLILTPTGDTLTTGGLRAEYANDADQDGTIYWANLGISRFEIEGARFQDFVPEDKTDVISIQASVMPETSFTPALAVGVRNISDEKDGVLDTYNERSVYAVVSKSIPVTGGVPGLFSDVKVHGGYGTGALNGLFFGAEGTFVPAGLRGAIEYDTHNWNWDVSYGLAAIARLKVYRMSGDVYYGAVLGTKF